MILDSCCHRSDHQLEFQIQDRISFRPVLALSLDDAEPEAKTICLFRPQLHSGRTEQKTFSAPKGQMVAANMVVVPRQCNSREENKSIKNGLNHSGDQVEIVLSTN